MKIMKFILACSLALASVYLTGCASGQPISGLLYSDVQGPINATGASRGGMHGQSCASSYLGLVALGDASITAAAKAANVTQISHVEQSYTNILGFWAQYCTIVYGNRGITPSAPMKVPGGQPAAPAPAPGGTGL
ncbi:MAG: TRL-like family protein [Bdellovibrionaceae bacterium]|nr:TRL-like family protein [Pseudobdellovibrionaceae bacterium]